MVTVKPFCAVRPTPQHAAQVAALPYDVMNSDEAREMVKGKPFSFLHVDKAEVDLDPSVGLYDDAVYAKAKENLASLREQGVLQKDTAPRFYIYRLTMDGRSQAGIVGCPSIDDYLNGNIKRNEHTLAAKEADRIRHVDVLDANTGPIFLTHRPNATLSAVMAGRMQQHSPVYDFIAEDGIRHEAWVVDDEAVIQNIEQLYQGLDALYIADGHHRCASAVKVGQKRRQQNPGYTGAEEFNYFLSVIFPADQLKIMDYNRAVQDLGGRTADAFLEKLATDFTIAPTPKAVHPAQKHSFGMYLGGNWYQLAAKPGIWNDADPVGRLDVSILQDRVLAPLLDIPDPRTSSRISFVGGIRGLAELERLVDGGMAVAFSMHPTTLDDLMAIADAGLIMPPKSTWFEPKLRSGLFIHDLT